MAARPGKRSVSGSVPLGLGQLVRSPSATVAAPLDRAHIGGYRHRAVVIVRGLEPVLRTNRARRRPSLGSIQEHAFRGPTGIAGRQSTSAFATDCAQPARARAPDPSRIPSPNALTSHVAVGALPVHSGQVAHLRKQALDGIPPAASTAISAARSSRRPGVAGPSSGGRSFPKPRSRRGRHPACAAWSGGRRQPGRALLVRPIGGPPPGATPAGPAVSRSVVSMPIGLPGASGLPARDDCGAQAWDSGPATAPSMFDHPASTAGCHCRHVRRGRGQVVGHGVAVVDAPRSAHVLVAVGGRDPCRERTCHRSSPSRSDRCRRGGRAVSGSS